MYIIHMHFVKLPEILEFVVTTNNIYFYVLESMVITNPIVLQPTFYSLQTVTHGTSHQPQSIREASQPDWHTSCVHKIHPNLPFAIT